jgi:polyisoprenoid-binding protein YceI
MADREIAYSISSANDSTIVAEVLQTRLLRQHKYFLAFGSFTGELRNFPDQPERSQLALDIDVMSISCRDGRLNASKQGRAVKYLRGLVKNAATASAIQFRSHRITPKALRGLVVEGMLTVHGVTRAFKMNAVFAAKSEGRLEIEADSIFRFSEFGIDAPSSLFGMVKTSDQAVIHFHLLAAREASP